MTYKWIGAILIVTGCGGAGFSIASQSKREALLLRQLLSALEYMGSQLAYQLLPLPQVCRQTASGSRGLIRKFFSALADALEKQRFARAEDCVRAALAAVPDLPRSLRAVLFDLGRSLGQLDLSGQLQGLESAADSCRRTCAHLEQNQDQRLRSYQTLSFCTGAALVILLL